MLGALPVVYVSGHLGHSRDPEQIDPAVKLLRKPFRSGDLVAAVTDVVGRAREQAA